MYACAPIHIHTNKTFFYAIRKFYFVIKRRRKIIIAQNRSITRRSYVAIAVCNKQLTARLATSMASRISSRACINQ